MNRAVFEKAGRVTRTVICLAQFALQTLWLGKWVLPRILNKPGVSLKLRNKVLLTINKHLRLFIKTLAKFKQVKLKFIGKPLKTPCIVVANHPTYLDYIALLFAFPKAVCFYRSEALENPVVSSFVQAAGYIEEVEGSREASMRVVEQCFNRLREEQSLIVFPESMRSKAALKPQHFRTTVFHAAIESKTVVQPVAIWCEPLFLGKDQSWFSFANPENKMVVSLLKPIELKDLPPESRNAKGLAEASQLAIENELQRLERCSGQ